MSSLHDEEPTGGSLFNDPDSPSWGVGHLAVGARGSTGPQGLGVGDHDKVEQALVRDYLRQKNHLAKTDGEIRSDLIKVMFDEFAGHDRDSTGQYFARAFTVEELFTRIADALLASGVVGEIRLQGHEEAHMETRHWHGDRPDEHGRHFYSPNSDDWKAPDADDNT